MTTVSTWPGRTACCSRFSSARRFAARGRVGRLGVDENRLRVDDDRLRVDEDRPGVLRGQGPAVDQQLDALDRLLAAGGQGDGERISGSRVSVLEIDEADDRRDVV